MPEKLVLVDGNSLMYRAYHALPPLDNGEGVPTNAVYGFLSMLLKALADEKPVYCAVAFDPHGPTFRHADFEAYKGDRPPTPDDLRPQFPIARELLGAMGIEIMCVERYEADDLLGTLSKKAEEAGLESVLITGDRDSFQLVSPMTSVLYTKRGISDTVRVTPEYILETYGVTPVQLIDMKGLMGDTSDNIPGVPGVGEKTASKLVAQYGSLEKVLETAPEAQKGKLRERLMEYADQARLSKKLATIERDMPVKVDLKKFRLGELTGALPGLEAYKLKSLIPRLKQFQPAGAAAAAPAQEADAPKPWREIKQFDDLGALNAWASGNARNAAALAEGEALSVALQGGERATVVTGGDLLNAGLDALDALIALKPILESGEEKILPDVKAFLGEIAPLGIQLNGPAFDARLAGYVLDSSRKKYALQDLTAEGGYDAHPASALYDLARAQKAQLEEAGMTRLYHDIELPLTRTLYDMEREGFLVDREELKRLGASYAGRIADLTEKIHGYAGYPVNINSTKQLGELLFDRLGLSAGRKTSRGYSTDADTLENLYEAHPIVPLILEHRKYQKLNGTYIEGLLKQQGPDGRIHTSFDQTVAATGRISSVDPNLQNIPVRSELGREIRKAFVARPGWMLVDADYSQIELRVLAHMSDDPVMIDAFLKDQDIHRRTAAEVYGVPLDQVTGAMRSAAKAVNFGIVYGISDFGLARNIGVSRKQAAEFIERYLTRYAGIKRFMDASVAQGKLQGYVTTLFGRRRYLPELASANYNIRSFGERAAMNSPIQGTAADIIKLAMVEAHRALTSENLKARLILQVHDELIVESPPEEIDRASALLKGAMEGVASMSVPLKVDLCVGRDWNACK
jgi:DNA polymerase-1